MDVELKFRIYMNFKDYPANAIHYMLKSIKALNFSNMHFFTRVYILSRRCFNTTMVAPDDESLFQN